MFHLAQVLCSFINPALQRELELTRREVIREMFSLWPEKGDPAWFAPRRVKATKWFDFQITPEITNSIQVGGCWVERGLAERLIKLHKAQIQVISNRLHRKP